MSSCVQGGRAGEDGQAGTGRRTSLRSGACRTQQRAMHDRETGLAGRIAAACDMDPLGGLAGAEALIAPYRAARPRATPARLYAAIASDRRFGFGRRGRRAPGGRVFFCGAGFLGFRNAFHGAPKVTHDDGEI